MKLKQIILSAAAALTLMLAVTPAFGGTAFACGNTTAAQQVLGSVDQSQVGANCGTDRINNIFGVAVNILSIIVGVTSVIVIILAGFKYITSGGEAGKVSNAKSTLLYAVVGLAVAALAQALVHFVLFQAKQ